MGQTTNIYQMGQILTFKLQIYTKWVNYQHLDYKYIPNGSNIIFTKHIYTKWVKYHIY